MPARICVFCARVCTHISDASVYRIVCSVWLYVCDCMTVNDLTLVRLCVWGARSLPLGWDDRGRLVNIIRGPGSQCNEVYEASTEFVWRAEREKWREGQRGEWEREEKRILFLNNIMRRQTANQTEILNHSLNFLQSSLSALRWFDFWVSSMFELPFSACYFFSSQAVFITSCQQNWKLICNG